jgi:hypothetical protein
LAILATVTGLIGLWTFVTGRPLLGVPQWPLTGRALRLAGAITAVECSLVVILAVTRGSGIAFVVYAIGSLAMAVGVHLARRELANI